jgi:glycosyltransferase involved in cell wall biosynthesis
MGMNLGVAICTHHRAAQLRRALESIISQSPAPLEILVVDNAPIDESTCQVCEDFQGVRYLREPVQGLDFARNTALREAKSEIVAFLDDDAVAAPGWAAAFASAFEANPNLAICTGRVEALRLDTPGERVFEANGGFSRGLSRIELPEDARHRLHGQPAPLIAWAVSVGSGCSYAVRRTVALELGGFDEALDLGAELPGGGDHDLLWRALQAGHSVIYEPSALAWHEHRAEASAAYAQVIGHQRALSAFLVKHLRGADSRQRLSLAGYLAWRLTKPGVRLLRRALGRDPLPVSVLGRMWWNCWAGLGAYGKAMRLAQQRRQAAG